MPSDKKSEQGTLELLFAPRAPAAARPDDAAPRPLAGTPGGALSGAMQQTPPAPVAAVPPLAQPIPPAPAASGPPAPAKQTALPAAVVEGPRTYKVSEIVRLAGRQLEARFSDVWVEGEISGYRPQPSGHGYFTLKDGEAVLPAVMWRAALARLRFRLADGLKVRAHGRLTIYPTAGKFQIDLDLLEPAGLGALQLAFEQLRRRLQAEGLFDEARKRPLPFYPQRIGLVTSPSGAAVRDIIRVAHSRAPVRLLIAPCLVQGEEAPADIVRALAAVQRAPGVDLIIVGRGGGSIEDLWAFNDERVARAIAASRVPVISAVGHEVDYTIADFVADRRAATPSQAAEIAVPVHGDLARSLGEAKKRLEAATRRAVDDARFGLDHEFDGLAGLLHRKMAAERRRLGELESRLRSLHPSARIGRDRALLVVLHRRLERLLPERLTRGRRTLDPLASRLFAAMQKTAERSRLRLDPLAVRLATALGEALASRRQRHAALDATLHALSPDRVLDRGYGLVFGPGGRVVTRPEALVPGDRIRVRFARGFIEATVIASASERPEKPEAGGIGEPASPTTGATPAPGPTASGDGPPNKR